MRALRVCLDHWMSALLDHPYPGRDAAELAWIYGHVAWADGVRPESQRAFELARSWQDEPSLERPAVAGAIWAAAVARPGELRCDTAVYRHGAALVLELSTMAAHPAQVGVYVGCLAWRGDRDTAAEVLDRLLLVELPDWLPREEVRRLKTWTHGPEADPPAHWFLTGDEPP